VLDEKIVCNKSVFSELDFDGYFVFLPDLFPVFLILVLDYWQAKILFVFPTGLKDFGVLAHNPDKYYIEWSLFANF